MPLSVYTFVCTCRKEIEFQAYYNFIYNKIVFKIYKYIIYNNINI